MVSNDSRAEGTDGNRRGPSGYLCCKHCTDDEIHNVETDAHDGPCGTCDDPGALLRELASRLEHALAVERAKVARVGPFLDYIEEVWDGCEPGRGCTGCEVKQKVADLRAALEAE